MYRFAIPENYLEVFLVHPGGPFWRNKDLGAWVIPRGNIESGEDLLPAAIREFMEETGVQPHEPYTSLGEIRHRSGKIVHAWAFAGTCEPKSIKSNTFEIEWPPKSGKVAQFPEVDRADFFDIVQAKQKILPAEEPFLSRLAEKFPEAAKPKTSPPPQVASQTLFEI